MELSTAQAAAIIGLTEESIRKHVHAGRLPARRYGVRRTYRIQLDDLNTFATQFNYDWHPDAVPNTNDTKCANNQ